MNNEKINLNNDELAHYGILGMKWGIRRTEAQLARAAGRVEKLKEKKKQQDKLDRTKNRLNKMLEEEKALKGKLGKSKVKTKTKPESENEEAKTKHDTEVKKVKEIKKKKLSEATNEEIQAKIDRMNLEKKYKELMAERQPKKNGVKWGEIGKSMVENSLKNIGTQALAYVTGTMVNKAAKKLFENIDEDIVNPKKGQKDK